MAERRVTMTRKDGQGDILALCQAGTWWSPRKKSDAISDIENGRHTYYVNRAGYRSEIEVVNDPDGKYLRTDEDATSANNLDNLPDC